MSFSNFRSRLLVIWVLPFTTKHMSLVKRVEISLREFIVRRHQFQLQRRIEKKNSQRSVWRKRPVSRWVLLAGSEKHYLPTACRFYSPEERKEKSCCLCACYLLFLTRVINGKIIEDEAIYNFSVDFWRFLVEDFLPVIKPPGTYVHNKLLPSCRSSKFSSSFPATSVLLCAPLDPVRLDRNPKSAWRQSVLIFLRQTFFFFFFLIFFN